MTHAISDTWARLARRITSRLAIPSEYATWHGWETRRIRPGTTQFRDPRFGQPAARTTQAPEPTPLARTWAQGAIVGRIRTLAITEDQRASSERRA